MVDKGNNEQGNDVAAHVNNQQRKVGQKHSNSNIRTGLNCKSLEKVSSNIAPPVISSNITPSVVSSNITLSGNCNGELSKETCCTCPICDKHVDSNAKAVECDLCDAWLHYSCEKLTTETIYEIEHNLTFQYVCHSCQSIKSIHDEKLVSNIGKEDNLNNKKLQKQNEEETILKSVELET